ncbi:DUF502 domain-containing protein [Aestuariibius sp. HNIBRBA575]|uniref:DUF502 domain-containing protein n=1 Tax=Aestuariibius sp. HNIBRBA575 TaxID=3233343 RepID=UPI0034A4AC74
MTKPDPDRAPRRRFSLLGGLRNSFLTGIVVIAPVGLTVWLIWTVVGWVDGFVWPFVPSAYHPDAILNRLLGLTGDDQIQVNVRGVGVIVFLIFTIFVGWLAKGFIGRSFIIWGEGLVGRMPVVRSIYNGAKQLAQTVFAKNEASFEKACLIEYPRKGIWAIGFISSPTKGEVLSKAKDTSDMLSIFVPTTPNPTSGFLLFFPRKDVIELDMSIEDAAKLVISAGLVYPGQSEADTPEEVAAEVEKLVHHEM